jgi:hypothetical protein
VVALFAAALTAIPIRAFTRSAVMGGRKRRVLPTGRVLRVDPGILHEWTALDGNRLPT